MSDVTLFDYQQEMLNRVVDAYRRHQSVMVQMPTGTGKTHLLAAVVRHEAQRGKNPCVWIVAHRRELVSQIEDVMKSIFPSLHAASVKVLSVQWLARHYGEVKAMPSLIVVDEAHHALARTYAAVMHAFPEAKKLGLTATPCRLNGKGFTDLFDVLLTSWSVSRFIAEGRLSSYDYYSIRPGSEDQRLIDSLKKRGTDGDYQLKELAEVMDVRPSLERLCQTLKQFVPHKKGIVYAVSIEHAEHLATFYRENGIHAVAISSQTPSSLRKLLLQRFKRSDFPPSAIASFPSDWQGVAEGRSDIPVSIQVLVNVDLFSEGFDCPDVEFVQLARPTLSLSKYLQMVGRGLRKAKGKPYCVILDNVGLYRRFGLPSDDRDWQALFEGRTDLARRLQEACMHLHQPVSRFESLSDDGENLTKIIGHDTPSAWSGEAHEEEFEEDKRGWIDRRSGVRFSNRPQAVRLLGVEFSTDDGIRFFPRIRSRFVDSQSFVRLETLALQVGIGIFWKGKYISANELGKVYQLCGKQGSVRLFVDDGGCHYVQGSPDRALAPVSSQHDLDAYVQEYEQSEKAAAEERERRYAHGHFYPVHDREILDHDKARQEGHDVWFVPRDVYGEHYWVDGMTGLKHYVRPYPLQRGYVSLLREGDWLYVRNIPGLQAAAFRNWQVVADDVLCVISNEFLFLKQQPRQWFKVSKRADDFSCLVVKAYDPLSGHVGSSDIVITKQSNGEVKMQVNGLPYVPSFQSAMESATGWERTF